jgi:predicted RNA-binding Zn ribbon-like protein
METGDVTVKLTRIYTKLGDAGETHRADTRRDGRQWQTPAPAHAALSTIARDAIELFGGTGANRIRECASPDCGFLFFDDSRPATRRWCSMNRCGNRAKVGRYRRRVAGSTA